MSHGHEPDQLRSIPQDIMEDILSRLPTKSLLKCRCVCKSWNILIQSQNFTEFHLNRAITNPSRNIVLLSVKPFWSIQYDDLDDFGKEGCDVIVKNDTHTALACLGSNNDFEVMGHCNGLICIVLKNSKGRSRSAETPVVRTFYLWNPSTKECRVISSKSVANESKDIDSGSSMFGCVNENESTRRQYCPLFEVFGFGYDSSIDDYKIVRLAYFKSRNDSLVVQRIEVFTIGTRNWRKKEARVKCDTIYLRHGHHASKSSLINMSLHWIISKDHWMDNTVILSFNLEQENVYELAMPSSEDIKRGNVTLRVMFEKLVLISNCNIWVMDEYGDETSWTKRDIVLPVLKHNRVGMYGGIYEVEDKPMPICLSKKGSIFVIVRDFHYMMFDPKEKRYRNSGGEQLKNRPHEIMYVESLISPNRVPNAG